MHGMRRWKLGLFVLSLVVALALSFIEARAAVTDYDRIVSDLNSKDWETRLSAVERLGTMKDQRKLGMLIQVADTYVEYWPVKIKAIRLLGDIGDPKAIEVLLSIFNDAFLNNECPSIKSHAAIALGSFNQDRRVVDALITGINDGELLTREASIDSLGRIGNPKAVPHLIPVLSEKSTALKLSTIKALAGIGDPQAVPHLRKIAENDSDSYVRSEAAAAIQNFSLARKQ